MESIQIVNDGERFDKAVHGGLDEKKVLPESGDMAIYVKPKATVNGNALAVVTFSVQLPDGSMARAQAVNTVANLTLALKVIEGWKSGGHI